MESAPFDDDISWIDFDSTGSMLCAAIEDGGIVIVDTELKAIHTMQEQHEGLATAAVFHPKRRKEVYSAGFDCKIKHWYVALPSRLSVLLLHF